MKKILFVLVTVLILASACAPKQEAAAPQAEEPAVEPDDSKLDKVVEKVEDLVNKITESTSESPTVEEETPTSRRIPESNPRVMEDTLPQPVVRLEMNDDPTLADPLVVERKGAKYEIKFIGDLEHLK